MKLCLVFLLVSLGTGFAAEGWWDGRWATGEWFGARERLEDRGVTIGGKWLGTVYGAVAGGRRTGSSFDEELKFDGKVDVAKLTGCEVLEGLSVVGGVRMRDGRNINDDVGASPAFNASSYQGGKQWRLMPFYASYTTPELFGRKHFLTISGGWQNPYDFFARQEDAKLFRNNVIVSGKGISSNGIGWSSSYTAWGGLLKVEPCDGSYVQGGMYVGVPGDAETANHGFDFAGARPANRNGVYALGEIGVTPHLAGRRGKYAVGGYYWGVESQSRVYGTSDGKFGLYGMAEQTLFVEPSGGGDSKQGLRCLALVNYAPARDNAMPFFFDAGLIYEGLIPTRDHDQLGIAVAYGQYSDVAGPGKTGEGLLEFDYRLQFNKWLFAQPFVQYLIRPGGTGDVANATVIGLHLGVIF